MAKTANSNFGSRSAKRAAEKLLAAGTAPAVDYGIEERQDGHFEIKWKTTPVPTGASEPLSRVPAKVGLPKRERLLSVVGGNAPSCPEPDPCGCPWPMLSGQSICPLRAA